MAPDSSSTRLPILTTVGVEGHVPITERMKEHFDHPIEIMSIHGQGVEFAGRLKPGTASRTHFFPDFCLANRPSLENTSDQEVLEETSAILSELQLTSVNPYHYFDRHLRIENDWSKVIRNHLLSMRFIKSLLIGRRYHFIRGENTSQIGCMIQLASQALGHRFLRPKNARISNRLEFDGPVPGELLGWKSAYEAFSQDGSLNSSMTDSRREALDWLDEFRSRPERPSWSINHSRLKYHPAKQLALYASLAAKRILKPFRQSHAMRKYDRSTGYARLPGAQFIRHVIGPDVRSAIHRRRKLFRTSPSLDGKFIYFPLHYTPEISTLVYGYRYENQFDLVRNIAAYLPTGYQLMVKEHTSMLGRRPYSFYKSLETLYNVRFVPPQVSTFDLISKSRGVAVITGTAGWEAFAKGKPVIAFGDVFFRHFPNVLGLEIRPDMGRLIKDYLENFKPDEKSIRDSIAAYFACTRRSTMVDLGEDTDYVKASTEADNFVMACEWALGLLDSESSAIHHPAGAVY